jgi:hypothetical protein
MSNNEAMATCDVQTIAINGKYDLLSEVLKVNPEAAIITEKSAGAYRFAQAGLGDMQRLGMKQ